MIRSLKPILVLLVFLLPASTFAVKHTEPIVTGSVEQSLVAAVGNEIQSTCSRRGIAEFIIPSLPGGIGEAALVFSESRGTIAAPRNPDTHEILFYEADLAVTVADYDRPATLITTIQTDVNEPEASFRIDVTEPVRQMRGRSLGIRFQLQDPFAAGCGQGIPAGSGFHGLYNSPPRIEFRVGPKGQ